MKEHEIYIDDWMRIFAGDVPPAFYAELALRAAYIFILLMICMRLLGKRMAAQLSRIDLAALVSLAAAIGVPVLAQDQGLLPSTLIAIVVVIVSKAVARLNFRNKKMETITIGDVSPLVEDGIINRREMFHSKLPRERLLAQLRSENIFHLGEVKRVYMESNGSFSIVRETEPVPGLLTLPSADTEYVNRVVQFTDTEICLECGTHVNRRKNDSSCPNCHAKEFTQAVTRK